MKKFDFYIIIKFCISSKHIFNNNNNSFFISKLMTNAINQAERNIAEENITKDIMNRLRSRRKSNSNLDKIITNKNWHCF